MRISDLEKLGFNKVHLEFMFDHLKSFNEYDCVNESNMEEKLCIDSLKLNSDSTKEKLQEFSSKVMEKDEDNKHALSSEIAKVCYSEITDESFKSFKGLSDATLRNNMKSWAEETSHVKRSCMLL